MAEDEGAADGFRVAFASELRLASFPLVLVMAPVGSKPGRSSLTAAAAAAAAAVATVADAGEDDEDGLPESNLAEWRRRSPVFQNRKRG